MGVGRSVSPLQRRDSFSLQGRECPSILCGGERLIPEKRECLSSLYIEEDPFSLQGRASVSSIERTETPPLCNGESVSLFSIERRQTPPLYKGESISLHYIGETPSLCHGEIVSLFYGGERVLLSAEESVSLLYREETPSLYSFPRRESVSLLYREEDSFSLQGERLSLL